MLDPQQYESCLVVRSANTPREIFESGRLKYDVYRRTRGVEHFDSLDHTHRIDLDVFDGWAHHLVMVHRTPRGDRVVATMRVVTLEPSPQLGLIQRAYRDCPTVLARLDADRPAELPLLSYLVQADTVRSHLERECARGAMVAEPTRLAASGFVRRCCAKHQVSAGALFTRAALAYGFGVLGLDRVYNDCDPCNRRLYELHGFQPIGDTVHQPRLGMDIVAMTASPADVPEALEPLVSKWTHEFHARREVVVARQIEVPHERFAA